MSQSNPKDASANGWPSEVMQKFREVKGSLWYIWPAQLIGWKERFEALLKKVDGGLGLGFESSGLKKSTVAMGQSSGLKASKDKNWYGLDKGHSYRPVKWWVKHPQWLMSKVLNSIPFRLRWPEFSIPM